MAPNLPPSINRKVRELGRQWVFYETLRWILYSEAANKFHGLVLGDVFHLNVDKAVKDRQGVLLIGELEKCETTANNMIAKIQLIEKKYPEASGVFDKVCEKWAGYFDSPRGKREITSWLSHSRIRIAVAEQSSRPLTTHEVRERLLRDTSSVTQHEINILWRYFQATRSVSAPQQLSPKRQRLPGKRR